MADPTQPTPGGDIDTWGQELNEYLSWLRGRIDTLQAAIGGLGSGGIAAHKHLLGDLERTAGVTISPTVQAVLSAANATDFRATIGAGTGDGTSDLVLGTGPGTAAEGDHLHDGVYTTEGQVSQMLDAAGRGVELGNTATTAAPGNHLHDDRYYTEAEVDTKLAGLGAGGNTVTTSAPITASTVVNNFLGAADSSAARTSIGAGTSSLAIGTSATTAARGDTAVTTNTTQTITGSKTFNVAPVVPGGAFPQSAIVNLVPDLAAINTALTGTAKVALSGAVLRGIVPQVEFPTTGVVDNDIFFHLPDA